MAAKTSTTTHDARTAPRSANPASRFAAIVLTGLGVIAIAACAVLLSYNGIYQIARQGGVDPRYAHIYPGAFTLLLLMAFWAAYVLHDAPRIRRLGVDAIILALILLAAFASALDPLGYALLPEVAVVVVAVAPWVALLIAFRIWLWMVSHLRGDRSGGRARRTRGSGPTDGTDNGDTAPLPAEPMPRPVDPGDSAKSVPRSEEPESVPSAPMQLWPRTTKGGSAPASSVRVLDTDTAETPDEAGDGSQAPRVRTSADETTPGGPEETPENPVRHQHDVSSSRSTPEDGSEAAASGSVTDSAPAATATAQVDGTPDTADGSAAADAEPAGSTAAQSGAADDSPTLGEQLRRALLPEGAQGPADTATDDAGTTPAPPLPKRTPKADRNPTGEAADVPDPSGSPATGEVPAGREDDGNEGGDPMVRAEPAEDGFVHELPTDDPTNDEADSRGEWTSEPAHEGSEPATDTDTDTASRVAKRPVALRPRRSSTADFPAAPPSGRVRSEPTPPENPPE